MFQNEFVKDMAARLFRTFLQVLFGSIALGGVPVFDEAQVNMLVGAVGLIGSLIPTFFSAWKAARAKKAAKLLNQGSVEQAKVVAAGQTGGLY